MQAAASNGQRTAHAESRAPEEAAMRFRGDHAVSSTVRRGVIMAMLLVPGLVGTAFGWSYGSNTVQNPSEDAASDAGYGPGWVLLSYMPNCPGVGYVFAEGLLGKTNSDHFKINDTHDSSHNHPTIDRWPWGFAHGAYEGCAFAYGTAKFEFVGPASSLCSSAPSPPPDGCSPGRCGTSAFCTDSSTDPFCSRRGVWGQQCEGEPAGKDGYALGCTAYANIGRDGVFSSSPRPTQPLGFVPAGALLDVRYVTKNRQYAWAKWKGHGFVNGVVWAFFPRSCISLTPPPPTPPPPQPRTGQYLTSIVSFVLDEECGNGAVDGEEQCDDGNTASSDGCAASCVVEDGWACGGEPSDCTLVPSPTTSPSPPRPTCAEGPELGCRRPFVPGKGSLELRDRVDDPGDRLRWKWLRGTATSKEDFGNPLTDTSYQLCIFDAAGDTIAHASAPAGDCDGRACWRATRTGFKYRMRSGSVARSSVNLILRAGTDGKAQIQLAASGAQLGLDPPPAAQPILVQLESSAGECWEATYSAPPRRNAAGRFADEAD